MMSSMSCVFYGSASVLIFAEVPYMRDTSQGKNVCTGFCHFLVQSASSRSMPVCVVCVLRVLCCARVCCVVEDWAGCRAVIGIAESSEACERATQCERALMAEKKGSIRYAIALCIIVLAIPQWHQRLQHRLLSA